MCARSPLSKSVPCSEAIRRCGGKNKLAMVEARLVILKAEVAKGHGQRGPKTVEKTEETKKKPADRTKWFSRVISLWQVASRKCFVTRELKSVEGMRGNKGPVSC